MPQYCLVFNSDTADTAGLMIWGVIPYNTRSPLVLIHGTLTAQRDEAQFWLNGYVNKQNCRIWSEANPQVYLEAPLHPEKLTVWCALWAGGILLRKR
ncbi:hypothetical protein TNCV_4167801 [Trichonephila clavipes]|nr:hypothetical protein TNCV_4167801 [Trichonephila clavipes]